MARFVDLPRLMLVGLVRGYRYLLSPWLGDACRFQPTCSAYALEALERHGAAAGSYLAVCRIGRCQPWCRGGLDPVPPHAPRLFAWSRPRPESPPSSSTDASRS